LRERLLKTLDADGPPPAYTDPAQPLNLSIDDVFDAESTQNA
jgi:hypothetical protein